MLLDENFPRKLIRLFGPDTEAITVAERGWKVLKNGELLAAAEAELDALVTADRRIPCQQDLSRFDVPVVILEAKSDTLEDLTPLTEGVIQALRSASRGTAVRVAAGSTWKSRAAADVRAGYLWLRSRRASHQRGDE